MGKGISIPVAADTRQFSSAVAKGVVEPLEDVEKALEGVTKEGDQAGAKLEDSMRDAQRGTGKLSDGLDDARRDTEKLGDEQRRLGDVISRESRQAGRNLGDNIKRGTDRAEDGFDDLKSEAAQSARETAASFREVSDVGDLVQEVLANSLGGFGPIGIAAGIAGAAGFGILTEAINTGTEESKQRVAAMYDDMIASGQKFVTDSYVSEAIQQIQTDAEGAIASYADAQDIASRTGASLSTVLRGLAGDTAAQAEVERARTQALTDAQAAQEAYIAKNGEESASLEYNTSTLEVMASAFDKTNSEKQTAIDKARVYADAMAGFAEANGTAAGSIDVVKEKLAALPANQTIRLDVDDSALERAITRQQGRTIQINVDGVITRIGNQVY